jgi:disulfide oxidoreductase YuzD
VETTHIAAYYLQMRYGEAVQVEYFDLTEAENRERFSDLVAVAEDRDLPYPLVAVNDLLRLAGSAHYYQILPLVEEALQSTVTA